MPRIGDTVGLVDVICKIAEELEHRARHDRIVGERKQDGSDKTDEDEPERTHDERETEDPAPQVVLQFLLIDGFSLLLLREGFFADDSLFGFHGFRIDSSVVFHHFPPYFFISAQREEGEHGVPCGMRAPAFSSSMAEHQKMFSSRKRFLFMRACLSRSGWRRRAGAELPPSRRLPTSRALHTSWFLSPS